MTPSTDYHVVNAASVTVYTSPDLTLACIEADRRCDLGEDVMVSRVVTKITHTEVYRPRAPKTEAQAIERAA